MQERQRGKRKKQAIDAAIELTYAPGCANQIDCVPRSSLVWADFRRTRPDPLLIYSDGSHPTPVDILSMRNA